MRRAGGHDDALAGKRALPLAGTHADPGRQPDLRVALKRRGDRRNDFERLRHAARPVFAAGHIAMIGADKQHAVLAQARDVALRCRMQPHAQVHGRCRERPFVGGEQQRRGEIVG